MSVTIVTNIPKCGTHSAVEYGVIRNSWAVTYDYSGNSYEDDFSCTSEWIRFCIPKVHYDDVIMGVIASQITSLTIVYSTVYSRADQSKHQSSASLAFVWGIHRRPVNSPHKWPVTRKMFPFDDVIMFKPLRFANGYVIYPTLHWVYYDLSMLGLKVNHDCKRELRPIRTSSRVLYKWHLNMT